MALQFNPYPVIRDNRPSSREINDVMFKDSMNNFAQTFNMLLNYAMQNKALDATNRQQDLQNVMNLSKIESETGQNPLAPLMNQLPNGTMGASTIPASANKLDLYSRGNIGQIPQQIPSDQLDLMGNNIPVTPTQRTMSNAMNYNSPVNPVRTPQKTGFENQPLINAWLHRKGVTPQTSMADFEYPKNFSDFLKLKPQQQKLASGFANMQKSEAQGGYYGERAGDVKEQQEERDYKRKERRSAERTRIVDRFNADPSVKKMQQMQDGANIIQGLATSDNPIAAGAIPTFMARASGEVGNLSEADKRPFGGSRAILERLEAAVKQNANGKLTKDNRDFILSLSDIMATRAKSNMEKLARTRAKQYSEASDFLGEEEIFKTISPENEFFSGGAGGKRDPLGIR